MSSRTSSHQDDSHNRRGRSRSKSPIVQDEKYEAERHAYRHRLSSRSPRRRSRSPSRSPERQKGLRGGRSYSRSRSRSPRHVRERHKRRRSRSPSVSDDHDDGARRHKSKKSDKHKRKSSRSRERKERKKEKKEKKSLKKKGSVTSQWGKHGIISEVDMYKKEAEFRAWLVEECKINPETLSKADTKKRFQSFVEDYNTATLPHEKFYDMQRYEARMSLLRNGEFVPQGDEDTYDPNADMQAHSNAHKRTAIEHESYLSKDQLRDLRRVQQERVEIAKRKQLGLEIKQNMGVRMDGSMFDD